MSFRAGLKQLLRALSLAPGTLVRRRRRPHRLQRLLLIALHQRGDVLWLTGLLRALQRGLPGCALEVWLDPRCEDVLRANPRISRLWLCDAICTDRTREPASDWRRAWEFASRLRARRYDAVLDATGVLGSSICGRWICAGGVFIGRSPQGLDLCYDRVLGPPRGHRIHQGLALLEPLGVAAHGPRPELWLQAEESAWAAQQWGRSLPCGELGALAAQGLPRRGLVLHPGAGWPAKQPSAAWWRKLLPLLAGIPLRLVHGPGEAALAASLAEGTALQPLQPPSFGALAALLLAARDFLGCDSGPAHLAGLAGCRGLVLFGPTEPREVRPWGNGLRVLQAADRKLDSLRPEDVAARLRDSS